MMNNFLCLVQCKEFVLSLNAVDGFIQGEKLLMYVELILTKAQEIDLNFIREMRFFTTNAELLSITVWIYPKIS